MVYTLYDTVSIRDGKVGVGTTNPSEAFHLHAGSMYVNRITNASSNVDFAYSVLCNVKMLKVDTLSSSTSTVIGLSGHSLSNVSMVSLSNITTTQPFISFSSNTLSNIASMHVENDVRVGKTLYASNLHVIGEFTTLDTVTSNTEQMTVTNAGSGPALVVRQTGAENVASFYDDDNLAMVVADGSKIGINTSSPTERLHVYDASSSVYSLVQTASSNAAQVKLTNSDGSTLLGPSADGTIDIKSTAAQPMRIGTNGSEMIRIAVGGNVGVGSTAPAYKLDVAGKTRVSDAVYFTTNGMNTIFYSAGNVGFSTDGSGSIGIRMEWASVTTNNKLAFRVQTKCHVAADSSVAYRKFETIVTPANDAGSNKPKQIVATEVADTNNDDFTSLSHTVTRNGTKSVDLVVSWSTTQSSYVGNVQIEVFAATALGDFTFTVL